jgi:acyl carrier protein
MNELDDIFNNVCEIIANSVGIDKESIKLEDTLFDELGIDSIDLVDILFELETLYDVELKVSDIEAKAKEELGDIPYEIDGVITTEGLEVLKRHMSEIDPSEIQEGLTVHKLVQLFSVHSLCKIVMYRLDANQ